MPMNYYVAPKYCVLCGEELIQQSMSFRPTSQSEEWLYSFRAVVIADSKHGPELTELGFFKSKAASSAVDIGITGSLDRPSRSVTISPLDDGFSAISCCFHSFCWSFLKSHRPWVQPIHIYSLAAAVNPRYDSDVSVNHYTDRSTLFRALAWLVKNSSSCGFYQDSKTGDEKRDAQELLDLLICVSKKLPPELISMVWIYLPLCPVKSLLSIAGSSINLLEKITPCESEKTGHIICNEIVSAYVMAINGEDCICGLDDGERLCGYRSEKREDVTINSPISQVMFSRGLYGIRHLRFYCQDGTVESLGRPVSGSNVCNWAGIFSQTTNLLQLSWDGLKLCELQSMGEGPEPFGERFLWDSDVPISLTNILPAETYYRDPMDHESRATRTLTWSPIRHLPLVSKQGRLYGITALCRPNGIVAIGAHFRSSVNVKMTTWVGRRIGCPIHFRLKSTEIITSIWTTRPTDSVSDIVFFTMKTSKNRTCNFGPVVDPAAFDTQLLGNQSHGRISGLYFPAGRRPIRSWGVYYSREKMAHPYIDGPPVPQTPQFPSGLHCAFFGAYVSRATLSDIQQIEVCSTKTRCTGMIITHSNGTQDVIGRWYEGLSSGHVISTLYNNKDYIQPEKLYLKLSTVRNYIVLREVALKPFAEDHFYDEVIFKNINFGDVIIWWFSSQTDIIDSI